MARILLVKTSSLGDVVHNFPVVSDIRAALPGAEIDWVVEESLQALPRLHPGVARALPVAVRRWRTGLLEAATRAEIRAFARDLKSRAYDAVIDTQGLLKSAWIAWLARGVRHGLDFASSREPLALFYDRVHHVPWTMHAVERNRALVAKALGCVVPVTLDYGIRATAARFVWLPKSRYVVLVHATSARSKLWPTERWIELGSRLAGRGLTCVLPWGGVAERERAEAIAWPLPGAVVAPALSLEDVAGVLAGAAVAVGVDTGLSHLAAALAVPTVGIYCATDPAATGLHGSSRAINLGGIGLPPAVADVLSALDQLGV